MENKDQRTASELDLRVARELGIETSSVEVPQLAHQDLLFDAVENPSDEIPQNGSNLYQEGIVVERKGVTVRETQEFIDRVRLALTRKTDFSQSMRQNAYYAEMRGDALTVSSLDSDRGVIYERVDGIETINALISNDLEYMRQLTFDERGTSRNQEPDR